MTFTTGQLELLSHTLRFRMVRPTTIGVNIIMPNDVSISKIDDHMGRYVGFFNNRPNGQPYSGLSCRNDDDIMTHLHVFYLRTEYKRIQPAELFLLSQFYGDLTKLAKGVINIKPSMPKVCDASMLLQSVEYSIGPQLIQQYKTNQIMYTHGASFVAFNPTIVCPTNCGQVNDTEFTQTLSLLGSFGNWYIQKQTS